MVRFRLCQDGTVVVARMWRGYGRAKMARLRLRKGDAVAPGEYITVVFGCSHRQRLRLFTEPRLSQAVGAGRSLKLLSAPLPPLATEPRL